MNIFRTKTRFAVLLFVTAFITALVLSSCSTSIGTSSGSSSSGSAEGTGDSNNGNNTTYYITFVSDGGTSISPMPVQKNDIPKKPSDPQKSGYLFDGWYTDTAFKEKFNFDTSLTKNITLYAKWKSVTNNNNDEQDKKKYIITFDSRGGSEVSPQTVISGEKVTEPEAPTKKDSKFIGWEYGDETRKYLFSFDGAIYEDYILYARWETEYTVTFNYNNGSDVTSQKVSPGRQIVEPENPERDGFIFDGWYTDEACKTAYKFTDSIYRTFTLYAKWIKKTYKVYFYADGGRIANNAEIPVQIVAYGKAATAPSTPAKANASFAGWYSDSELTKAFDFSNKITSDTIIYAKWTITAGYYQVRFDTNRGSEVETLILSGAQTVTQPANPTRNHYKFDGWYSNASLTIPYTFGSTITADTTIYAKWTEVPYFTVVLEDDISISREDFENGKIIFESDVSGDWYIDGSKITSNSKNCTLNPPLYVFSSSISEGKTYVLMFKYKTTEGIEYSYTIQFSKKYE